MGRFPLRFPFALAAYVGSYVAAAALTVYGLGLEAKEMLTHKHKSSSSDTSTPRGLDFATENAPAPRNNKYV